MALIYKVTNKENGKSYIGYTKGTLKYRKYYHYNTAFKNRGSYVFHKALRKYGKKNFIWEVLLESENFKELRDIKEEYYIRKIKTHYLDGFGYNMTYGGEGFKGKHSLKSKKQMSESKSGEKHFRFGKHLSKEHKQKISKIKKIQNKGNNNPNSKSIKIDNIEYLSLKEAREKTGLSKFEIDKLRPEKLNKLKIRKMKYKKRVKEWENKNGISYLTFRYRKRQGFSNKEALEKCDRRFK